MDPQKFICDICEKATNTTLRERSSLMNVQIDFTSLINYIKYVLEINITIGIEYWRRLRYKN